jgi:hypothetical protein
MGTTGGGAEVTASVAEGRWRGGAAPTDDVAEQRRQAHGSGAAGRNVCERERGMGAQVFFWINQKFPSATPKADESCLNFHRPPPPPLANGSYVNFGRLAPADGNYVISTGFPLSRRKLLWQTNFFCFS